MTLNLCSRAEQLQGKHLRSFYKLGAIIGIAVYLVACATEKPGWIVTKDRFETQESTTNTASAPPFSHQLGPSLPEEPPAQSPTPKSLERPAPPPQKISQRDLIEHCYRDLKDLPGVRKNSEVYAACQKARQLPGCESEQGRPIYHYDRLSKEPKKGKRIVTIALIHGDEVGSGSVARSWMTRLENLDPRNSWRVIPIANPDGWETRVRTNARKVDLNRNFPTKDWEDLALQYWKSKKKSDPRRYPGPSAASEKETRCMLEHFKEFDPHFIISVHTPLGVLDFDGPKQVKFPKFTPLPWISLGNFPGSLGRFMWMDNSVPVLTIELRGTEGVKQLERFDRLQDVSGTVAIQTFQVLEKSGIGKPQGDESHAN